MCVCVCGTVTVCMFCEVRVRVGSLKIQKLSARTNFLFV